MNFLKTIETIFDLLIDSILDGEKTDKDGQSKKEWVIEKLVKALTTPFGDAIERKILDLCIDLVVFAFNKIGYFNKKQAES